MFYEKIVGVASAFFFLVVTCFCKCIRMQYVANKAPLELWEKHNQQFQQIESARNLVVLFSVREWWDSLPEKWSPELEVIFVLIKLRITTTCACHYFVCRIWAFFRLVGTCICIWCVWYAVFLKPTVSFPENVHNAFPCWVPVALVRKNNKTAKSAVTC